MADHHSRAVYVISVAAELAGVHPQTLRIYERKGLLDPARPAGGNRRYSEFDLERLQRIAELHRRGPQPRRREAGARARGRDRPRSASSGAPGRARRARSPSRAAPPARPGAPPRRRRCGAAAIFRDLHEELQRR